jgi:hypothetical protein
MSARPYKNATQQLSVERLLLSNPTGEKWFLRINANSLFSHREQQIL